MKKLYTLLLIFLVSFPFVNAQSWNIAGDFNSWNNSGNQLYDDGTNGDKVSGDGIFSVDISIATAGRYEWKVTKFGSWDEAYPGDNAWIVTTADNQVINFTFDTNTYPDNWLPSVNIVNASDQAMPTSDIVAVGDHNSWNNSDATTLMKDDGQNGDGTAGDGIYTFHTTIPTAGTYNWKPTLTGTWDAWGSDGRNKNAANVQYTTAADNEDVYFYLDLNSGRVFTTNSPLPVELTAFTASVKENSVELKWTTATEINNNGFQIERTTGSKNWKKVGFVKGKGSTTEISKYSFVDVNLNKGFYKYRLKQIDFNGAFEYSDVVEVNLNSIPNRFVLEQNYPNPFNPSTTINFSFDKNDHASLKVYNSIGSEVAELFNNTVEAGKIYNINFNASKLSSGVYYYKLMSSEKTAVKKMLLMK